MGVGNEEFWRALLAGEKKGPCFDAVRLVLAALARLYCAGLWVYLALERVGIRRRAKAPIPVISIGNLSVGGTGKTPMAQLVARHFQMQGWRVAIASRGYRGAREGTETVVSDTDGHLLLDPEEAGDEASLLAATLPGVPVIVGKDRRRSAKIAVERFKPHLLLLDDALQYWQLARDLDIVLIDGQRPFDNGYPLPRGLLREPMENIRRAGVIVVTRSDTIGAEAKTQLSEDLGRLAPGVPVFYARHRTAGWRPANALAEGMQPMASLAVCAIAKPESFLKSIAETGIGIVGSIAFADHARYGQAEKKAITGKIEECGAKCIVTTEKDAVKMPEDFVPVPIFALRIEMEIENEIEFWRVVEVKASLVTSGLASKQGDVRGG